MEKKKFGQQSGTTHRTICGRDCVKTRKSTSYKVGFTQRRKGGKDAKKKAVDSKVEA